MEPVDRSHLGPAFPLYGAKFSLAPEIVRYIPVVCQTYLEPCSGTAAVLFAKPRSRVETIADIDDRITNFFYVLREHADELVERLRSTPWSRAEFSAVRARGYVRDPVERARRFYAIQIMSISRGTDWSRNVGWRVARSANARRSEREPIKQVARGLSDTKLDNLLALRDRLRGVQIDTMGYLDAIERYHGGPWGCVYIDPPYLDETRVAPVRYNYEWELNDHLRLLERVRTLESAVLISGYDSPLYREHLDGRGWTRVEFSDQRVNSSAGLSTRTEVLWINPRTVELLRLEEEEADKQLPLLSRIDMSGQKATM